ncbi:MAG: ATP synthase F1 subunit epsilon [Coriobacteriia bacterium]|nr:ATP synthase F1 subunit epsilon [Coriobacteriia bacterium]
MAMERTLLVEVVSPEANLYKGEATMVIATTKLGELGIMPLHAPMVAELAPGELRLKHGDDPADTEVFSVYGGYLSIAEDHLLVLADLAMDMRSMDVATIEARLENAKARLADVPEDDAEDKATVEREIDWLESTLCVAKRHCKPQ